MSEKSKTVVAFLKGNQWFLMFAAVVLGIVATLLVNIYIRSKILSVSGGGFVPIIVVEHDMDDNAVITEDDIMVENVPASLVHKKMISEKYKDFVIGQRAATELFGHQVLLWNDISVEKMYTLSQKLKLHQRAVSLFVDDATGLNGLLHPGDRVDVVGFFNIPSKDFQSAEPVAKVILQNITVLAIGSDMFAPMESFTLSQGQYGAEAGRGGADTVTLRVADKDVPLLIFAEKMGDLFLSLRGTEDIVTKPMPEVSFEGIEDLESIAAGKSFMKSKEYPAIYEGGKLRQNVSWPDDNFSQENVLFNPDYQKDLEQLIREKEEADEKENAVKKTE